MKSHCLQWFEWALVPEKPQPDSWILVLSVVFIGTYLICKHCLCVIKQKVSYDFSKCVLNLQLE